jgi:pimeloyl-ACP methyl ester carboxylesterase
MTEFLLLPGAWHGAWAYDEVAEGLAAAGHPAQALTLRGVGDQEGPEGVNLGTHLRRGDRRDVVVCAHSYAGMVLTDVLAHCAEHIAAAVYIDAFVPAPGDTLFELSTQRFRDHCLASAKRDGLGVAPIAPMPDARCTAHPTACFLEASRAPATVFDTFRRRGGRLHYLHFTGWTPSPFGAFADRLREDPGWSVVTRDFGHNAPQERPAELADLLLAAAAQANSLLQES